MLVSNSIQLKNTIALFPASTEFEKRESGRKKISLSKSKNVTTSPLFLHVLHSLFVNSLLHVNYC